MTYLLYFIYLITFRCNLSEEAEKKVGIFEESAQHR